MIRRNRRGGLGLSVDLSSRTVQLCIEGTQAEFERRLDDARRLFLEAWDARIDDYDAAVAAHYVGHLETDPPEALRWHTLALDHARRDDSGNELLGSLLVSLGGAHEAVGDIAAAERYYRLASEQGVEHFRG